MQESTQDVCVRCMSCGGHSTHIQPLPRPSPPPFTRPQGDQGKLPASTGRQKSATLGFAGLLPHYPFCSHTPSPCPMPAPAPPRDLLCTRSGLGDQRVSRAAPQGSGNANPPLTPSSGTRPPPVSHGLTRVLPTMHSPASAAAE